jgi:hypothetical protein
MNIDQLYHLTCCWYPYLPFFSHFVTPFITSDKWWPLWQNWTCNTKIIVGDTAMAYFWIHGMEYDQYRRAIVFDTLLVPVPVLLQSLWLRSSPLTNDGLSVKYEHVTAKKICITTMAVFWIHSMDYDQYKRLYHLIQCCCTYTSWSVTLTWLIKSYKWWPL